MPSSVLGAGLVAVGKIEALPAGSLHSSGDRYTTKDTGLCDVMPGRGSATGREI